jgi:uncharacterized damage-inducible protein DinB
MDAELLKELARHQAWADGVHWKLLRENSALLEDPEIRKRLNHMVMAIRMLTGLARGESPDPSAMKEIEGVDQLEVAMGEANAMLLEALGTLDLEQVIALPRGPNGPWEAPAGVLLLQAIQHGQHHRGQNASRMRQLGGAPPLTDYLIWCAFGRP